LVTPAWISAASDQRGLLGQDHLGLRDDFFSLEAIFLSRFVMISQNRGDAKHQIAADLQWQTERERTTSKNQQLLELSNQILHLTAAIHSVDIVIGEVAKPKKPRR
jgi:uncharacterized membrane protein